MEQDRILHPTWPSCLTFSAAGRFGSFEVSERGKGRHMAGVGLHEMKAQIINLALAVLLGITVATNAEDTNVTVTLAKILPNGWKMTEIVSNAVPYNLGIQQGQPRGTRLKFVGPSIVKGPRGINDEKEPFNLWLMPAHYVPIPPETLAQFQEARLLGTNDQLAVYWNTFTTGTSSWPSWSQDIQETLGLKKDTAQPPLSP